MYFVIVMMIIQAIMQQQKAKEAAKAQTDRAEAQNQLAWQEQEIKAKQQRDLLARQQAETRARLGASGMGDSSSGTALLEGMTRRAEGQIADSYDLTKYQLAASQSANPNSSGAGLQQGLAMAQQVYQQSQTSSSAS